MIKQEKNRPHFARQKGRKMNKSTMSDEELNERREKIYKQISRSYTLLRKLNQLEDAQKMVESIWRLKKEALELELEVIKRETS